MPNFYIDNITNIHQSYDDGETYDEPTVGKDLVLTVDMNIQAIVEKYLEEACIDNKCTDGGNVIIMNPKNGDILAMATYPYYDLNSPYTINDEKCRRCTECVGHFDAGCYMRKVLGIKRT